MLFGRKDFSPSVNQQILISSELLLFFLEASCRGHKPELETLLLNRILWHDEFVVVEACLVSGGRQVVLYLFFGRSLRRAGSSILLL